MKLSDKGFALLIELEGLKRKPYLDSAGIPTIGIGSTYYPNGKKVTMQDLPITEQEAKLIAANILKQFEDAVLKFTATVELNQNQFDALVLLAYNIGIGAFKGSSVLRSIVGKKPAATIEANWLLWNKAGGKVLAGLVTRRTKELSLYFA